ncbi:MAG: autotransporter outer membrane beta-barrel domain-containing protein [Deltaproteobacteria bacterium]|nr:autotransporter outer membrane beta-barrel domain-containing protein [Deltaproteobacteria bacterium]
MTGTGLGAANWFAEKTTHALEIPVQVKINGEFNAGKAKIIPELRLGWTYMAQRPDNELNIGFVGSSLSTTVYGTKPKRSSFQVGAGVKIDINNSIDVFVNYDLDLARGYRSHMTSAGLGINF